MFGISLGEILLIGLVAIIALKPEDFKIIYSQFRKLKNLLNKETNDIKNVIKKIDYEIAQSIISEEQQLNSVHLNPTKNNFS